MFKFDSNVVRVDVCRRVGGSLLQQDGPEATKEQIQQWTGLCGELLRIQVSEVEWSVRNDE